MKTMLTILCGLAIAANLVGCTQKAAPTPAAEDHADEHGHGAGPHGGKVLEWGDGAYHLELAIDHDAKSAAAYVLGGDAKTPAPIKADKLTLTINKPELQLDLAAKPLEGESGGLASRFIGTHERLEKLSELAGTIAGEVEGTPYATDFTLHVGDDGHDH